MSRTALQNLRFTDAENKQLETALRQPTYRAQIDRLLKTVKPQPALAPQRAKSPATLKQEQALRIETINKNALSEAQKLLAVSAQAVPSTAMRAVTGTAPTITSISSSTIEPGQSLIIRGTDFLPKGSVIFTFGGRTFTGSITYWAADFILVTLPGLTAMPQQEGTVTVQKPHPQQLASKPIQFIPIWDYYEVRSDQMTYLDNPYDPIVALYNYYVYNRQRWCSFFKISFPTVPGGRLLNTYKIDTYIYKDEDGDSSWREYPPAFTGLDVLPQKTAEQICHRISSVPKIFCYVTIKGPRGLNYI